MIVVSNATPIITLACVNQIDIFKHFFDKVYIPQAVYDEIKSKRAYGHQEIDDSFLSFPSSRWECIHFIIVALICIPTQERWERDKKKDKHDYYGYSNSKY